MTAREASSGRQRKGEHLRINLEEDVTSKGITTGFEQYRFVHQALPDLDLAGIDTTLPFFGRRLAAPLLISSMTGGIPEGGRLNRTLAEAAQHLRIAIGLGSVRVALEEPEVADTFRVRDLAPDVPIFANFGAVQLNYGFGLRECLRAVELAEADALILHLNPLQEALQVNGNTNFAGLVARIAAVCRELPVPVIVKEVGWGISPDVALRLADAGVAAIDVAGAGGTSWSEVELHRAGSEHVRRVAEAFAGWGIPTAESLRLVRAAVPALPVIASGGIRSGLDVAKAIALGADAAGVAGPALRAAAASPAALRARLAQIIDQLRLTMFCIGAGTLAALRGTPHLRELHTPPANGYGV
ncbi:MAG TPA: type 2 isopentenyl-diphosphate Delta-isomerase [Dehalococcoidia bacterium]|nr:type 2 isopentenyl-diphosphate Delta-isomerase [Dehalococcoidia bacterium]